MKTAHNLFKKVEQMDGGTGFMRNNEKEKFIKSYKEKKLCSTMIAYVLGMVYKDREYQ